MADLVADADRRYVRCFEFTHREEGGLADRPATADPGGITNYGLSLRFARGLGTSFDLDGDGDVDRDDIILVTPEHTRWAFREMFWRPIHGDRLWPGLDLMAFDMAVHSGAPRATRFMQRALGVTADGVIGPQTLNAIAAARRDDARKSAILARFAEDRRQWLADLPNAPLNPGWRGRVQRVHLAARQMARLA